MQSMHSMGMSDSGAILVPVPISILISNQLEVGTENRIYRIVSTIRHSTYSSPWKNLSKCILIADNFSVFYIRHITLFFHQTGSASR